MDKIFHDLKNHDMAIFVIRLGLAISFIAHGWQKFQTLDGVVMFFGSLGLHPFFAYLVATVELLGGIAMLLGVFTDWAATLLGITMVSAIYLVKLPNGLLGGMGKPGYEVDLLLLAASLAVLFYGPGKHTVKEWMKK